MRLLLSSLVVVLAACGVDESMDSVTTAVKQEALSASHCPASVPVALAPAADQALWRVLAAEGVQIYRCTNTATGPAWVFESPDALLRSTDSCDDEGDHPIVGHHYAGPTWEFKDRSTVVGVKAAAAPAPVATAIPWLLLNAVSHAGSGRFTEVTSIQRMDTEGGLAPGTGCDATTINAAVRVPYTANYYLYRARPGRDNTEQQCR